MKKYILINKETGVILTQYAFSKKEMGYNEKYWIIREVRE